MDYIDDWYYLDVLKWAQHLGAKKKFNSADYKLTSLKEAMNIEHDASAHRADADVIVMGHVISSLLLLQPPETSTMRAVALDASPYSGKFSRFSARCKSRGQMWDRINIM